MTKAIEAIEELAAETAAEFNSKHDVALYLKYIAALGIGMFREAVGEVRMRVKEGLVSNPAAFLAVLLRDWAGKAPEVPSVQVPSTQVPSVQAQGIQALDIPSFDRASEKFLEIPYSARFIPHVRDIRYGDFFTFWNDKRDSDWVITTVHFGDKSYRLKMFRGKKAKEERGMGINTTEDWRVLEATVMRWVKKGGRHNEFEYSKGRLCVVDVTAAEIAEEIKVAKGSNVIRYVTQKVFNLANSGYYFVASEDMDCRAEGIEDFSFQFFGEVQSMTRVKNGKRERFFRIKFSEPFSRMLLERRVVRRNTDMLAIQSGLTLKLYDFLCRIHAVRTEYSIPLRYLIKELNLPPDAGWHATPSGRKREFEKATNDIHGRKNHNGAIFRVTLEAGLNDSDFMLVSRVEDSP